MKLKQKKIPIKLLLIGGREANLNPISQRTEDIIAKESEIIETGQQKDIRPFVKASKLLVLPSYREGFGLVLIEAGAMGVPVVSSDIIGCNNVVIPEINGLFCQPRSVDSLVEALERMYYDKELYTKIASQTRQSIINRFEQETVQAAYVEHYKKLLTEDVKI
ncbi:glycosyltransferase [Phocaeicola massiliensis]|uniref:glycosyltransferase n=1 Tax=Phocaeicola massiliensis TaxID=204516 RepID=UPI0032C0C8EE